MDVEHEDHKMKVLPIKTLLTVMFSLSVWLLAAAIVLIVA